MNILKQYSLCHEVLSRIGYNLYCIAFPCSGSGGHSYLYEPMWWAGMITSKYGAEPVGFTF